jgi:5,5'-dehydrodivanillate O-demethylase
MGEELVLYRDRSGILGLVDKYCTHRRASLAYGVVEEHGIRCQYHGWKFDETGRCIEQPFEDTTHPEDRFRDKCGIRAYQVQELGGLIFAYMGPSPAPLLPRWAPLVWDNAVRDIAITELPANWLQCQENSLDPVHLEWLHGYSGSYFRKILAGEDVSFGDYESRHAKIRFEPFEHGIIKQRLYKGQTEDADDWAVGHPVLFPNILLVGNPLSNTLQFRVPVDDTHTMHFSLYTWRTPPGIDAPKQETIPSRMVELTNDQGQFQHLDILFNQDYMCWATQGDIAKRELEKLGESDKGIILFRKQLLQQLQLMEDGGSPSMCVFNDPAENECIELSLEPSRFDTLRTPEYRPSEAGYSRDADLINAVMATWKEMTTEKVRELLPV